MDELEDVKAEWEIFDARRFKRILISILGIIGAGIIAILIIAITQILVEEKLENSPILSEQAEVVGKEISRSDGGSTRFSNNSYYNSYYVDFKFSDGSEKRFRVARIGKPKNTKEEIYCAAYEALYEGDTGILTYKEVKNATKWQYRYFVSFEKDSEQTN